MIELLEIRGITKKFGGLTAVDNVSFNVNTNEILGLVGPNGAGKTTLLNVINGIYRPDSGTIRFESDDVTKLKPHELCNKGIARTFQIVHSFSEMSVIDNVITAGVFGRKQERSGLTEIRQNAKEVLEFVNFELSENTLAGNLNIVQLKKLSLARALITNPKLILLDEVTTGLNPTECLEAVRLIKRIRKSGITVLIVEHVMRVIMNLCDRIVVIHHGRKLSEGTPKEIASDEKVIDAYLGEKYVF